MVHVWREHFDFGIQEKGAAWQLTIIPAHTNSEIYGSFFQTKERNRASRCFVTGII